MPIAIVEMSSRSKKVGYIRMFNDRTQFESLMFYVFLILYLLFLYWFGRSRVWMGVWFFFSDTNSMFMIFLYIFRGIGIISFLDLILLHNCLHFLENIFDLWLNIQTGGGKRFLGRADPPSSHPILVRCPCCLQYFTMQIQQYGKI